MRLRSGIDDGNQGCIVFDIWALLWVGKWFQFRYYTIEMVEIFFPIIHSCVSAQKSLKIAIHSYIRYQLFMFVETHRRSFCNEEL